MYVSRLEKSNEDAPVALSYPALKSVLRHFEPNLRIQISQKCPTIKLIDQKIPLQIDELKINEHCFTINETVYKLEVETSLGSRATLDLDHYGAIDTTQTVERLPGEILIDGRLDYSEKDRINSELEQLEVEQERIEGIQDEEEKARAWNKFKRRAVIHQINTLRLYAPRGTVIQIPISFYLRLTVGKHHKETLRYTSKLHDALKHLLQVVLGDRKNIRIRKLQLSCAGILRIPSTLDLQFQHLKLGEKTDEFVRWINPLIENLKEPLESVDIDDTEHEILEGPIFESARLLILGDGHFGWPQLAGKRNVCFKDAICIMDGEMLDYLDIWLAARKDVGTCWWFALDDESQARTFLEIIKKDDRVQEFYESSVKIPMNNSTEAFIFYEKNEHRGEEKYGSWELKFTVRKKKL